MWAAVSFFGTGAQPAQALPDNTLGYVSIDLDPSGGQKIEALRTLRKFPAFEDEIGLDTDDDVRQRIFEEVQNAGACDDLDYGDDIEPWLGDRFAVAAIDSGEELPHAVVVIQVKDADAAEDGLTKLQECSIGESAEQSGGWSIDGEWAVLAETEEIAADVAADAAESPLSDDEDFTKWTGEAGDPGILTAYAAPEAGVFIADSFDGLFGSFSMMGVDSSGEEVSGGGMPEELRSLLEDFEGAAVTVRFDDGSLEVETASSLDFIGLNTISGSDQGADVVSTLPEDTAAAFGVGFEEGWFDELVDYAARFSGGVMDTEAMIAEAEAQTGLALPEDAETLAGESVAIAVSSDFDAEALFSGDSSVPIGVKIKGDAEGIESVLDKLRAMTGPEEAAMFVSDSDDGMVVVGPNTDYLAELLEDGDLGDSDTFQDVVREADRASSVAYVNFDAGDNWLANLAGDDEEVRENLEPLAGFGLSGWEEDGVGHAVLRITTN